jgi:DNA-binding HxlR family transcriptional regulator
MKNEPLCHAPCPIARSLGRIGDSWSIMILRDAASGFTRFDEFQKSSNVAPNILSRRLKSLVDDGLLEKICYSSTAALRIPPHAKRSRFSHGAAGDGGMG